MTAKDHNATEPVGPEMLAELVDRHAAALVLYARQLCGSADDVVQEAYLKLSRQRRVPDAVLPWLYRVVRNGAISAARSRRRRKKHEAGAAQGREAWFVDAVDQQIDARAAAEAIQTLSADDREVVVARVWGGLTFVEIGQLVGTSDSTAHRRYEAALKSLRARLETACPNTERPKS